MQYPAQTKPNTEVGCVLEATRRHVTLRTDKGIVVTGSISARAMDIVCGDFALYETRGDGVFVTEVLPAKRSLYRALSRAGRPSSSELKKRMGANIDLLFVMTAIGETFNPEVIDRMLIAASVEEIPSVLLINKSDLGAAEISHYVEAYSEIASVVLMSAKQKEGLGQVISYIERDSVQCIALCGVSGVGKSTLLNLLVPAAAARTGEVSERTGQGRQTTSQPRGFVRGDSNQDTELVIDLPGVQLFGLSYLSEEELRKAFPDFVEHSSKCRFLDCKHVQEEVCGVKSALADGLIGSWRYDTYRKVLDEIADGKAY